MWYGRKQWNATHFLNQSKIALVTMQHTPGARQLVHVESEIKVLEEICSSVVGECVCPELVRREFSATVETCTIFHFAGHGDSKVGSLLKSLLLLRDWQSSPFIVADIMNMEIGAPQRFLAYLSACGTGQVLESAAMDESIHLIGAFQLAGFHNIVGTPWEVDDELCVLLASLFYHFIKDNGLQVGSVSRGLTFTCRSLRDRWVGQHNVNNFPGLRGDHLIGISTADDGDIDPLALLWVS